MPAQPDLIAIVRQFAEDRGIDPTLIVPKARLADLGVDSMHLVDLAFRFEEAYDIEIPMEEFRAETVEDAITFVAQLVDARH